jgi:dTMP kinase
MDQLNQISHQGLMPHRTYLLMVDPNEGLKRAQKKGPDRFEEENLTFHEKVSAKYLQIAKENAERIKLIEGNYSIEQTFEIIFNDLKSLLPKK